MNHEAPHWLTRIVKAAADGVKAQGVMGPLGWSFKKPVEARGPWEIAIYPTPCELYAGPMDGKLMRPCYLWSLGKLLDTFDEMPSVAWLISSERNDHYQGEELALWGTSKKRPVWLRLFSIPPKNEDPTVVVDTLGGSVWRKGDEPKKEKAACKKKSTDKLHKDDKENDEDEYQICDW